MNKSNFHMKGLALGLALKQRRKATQKLPILGQIDFIRMDFFGLNCRCFSQGLTEVPDMRQLYSQAIWGVKSSQHIISINLTMLTRFIQFRIVGNMF